MPFTFAHPAVVLPIKKKWPEHFNLTALILGSMAPDFEYFVKMRIESKIGHSFIGFLLFNLPLVIGISLVFHYLIKNTFILHLPEKINSLIKQKENNTLPHQYWIKWCFIFICSAIIGMFSHTLWDSFTHEKGYFVLLFPILKARVINIPIYKFLQHGGTFIGFLVISKFLFDERSRECCKWKTVSFAKKILYWILVLISTIAVIIIRLLNENQSLTIKYLGTIIVTCIPAFFLSLTLASVVFYETTNNYIFSNQKKF